MNLENLRTGSPQDFFLFFINADSDLQYQSLDGEKVILGSIVARQIRKAVTDPNSKQFSVIYLDTPDSQDVIEIWDSGKLVTRRNLSLEPNSSDPKRLVQTLMEADVILQVKKGLHPNFDPNQLKRHLLIWGHGLGFRPIKGADFSHPNTSFDPIELANEIQKYLNTSNINLLESVIFDSCLMSTMEILSEYSKVAKNLIASQTLVPFEGMRYSEFPNIWNQAKGNTVAKLESWISSSNQELSAKAKMDVVFTQIDLEQYKTFESQFSQFLQIITPNFDKNHLQWDASLQAKYDSSHIDFTSWMKQLLLNQTTEVEIQGEYLMEQFNQMISQDIGNNGQKTGVSLYYPGTVNLLLDRVGWVNYEKTQFSKNVPWLKFLRERQSWLLK